MTKATPPATTKKQTLAETLANQHSLHGMLGEVFEELGGKDFLLDWAEENPDKFITHLMRLAPPAIPKGQQGAIHLHVHSDLQPSALDVAGVTIDQD